MQIKPRFAFLFIGDFLSLKIILTWRYAWPKFLSFAGFNGLDFYIRWIQLVVVFLVTFFVAFAVILFVHRNVFAFEDYLNRALRLALVSLDSTVLLFTFAGFNLLLIPVVAFFVVLSF